MSVEAVWHPRVFSPFSLILHNLNPSDSGCILRTCLIRVMMTVMYITEYSIYLSFVCRTVAYLGIPTGF